MKQINLRLPEELKRVAERYARFHGYKNIQELAKESIRMKIGADMGKREESGVRIKGTISGKELIEKLSPETRKGLEEISKKPKSEWKRWYKEIEEKEKLRAKFLMQAF